jgi:single-stranded-DNA-specific exonuclease
MATRTKVAKNHPELHLGLAARPTDDPRELLFTQCKDSLIRPLLRACPGVACKSSDAGRRLIPTNVHPSERWRWPGDKLVSQRHQIHVPQFSEAELVERMKKVETLITECGISPILAQVLVGRDHTDPAKIKEFLEPSIANELASLPLYGPLHYAAYFLHAAVLRDWHIVVVSDYDADGNCSAAILKRSFDAIGARSTVVQPDRVQDGYGLGDSTLRKVEALKPNVVITLDCGTSNQRQIAALNSQNVLTIVVDHHELPPGKTASPDIMVNPKSDPEWAGYQGLCASGLTWLLCDSLLGLRMNDEDRTRTARDLLPLAAYGTVGDVMELSGLNRAIVREGFNAAAKSPLAALKVQNSKMRQTPITGAQVGFGEAPLFNAPGRISPASEQGPGTAPTLELLTTDDQKRATELLTLNQRTNERRKVLEREGLQQARTLLAQRQKKGEPIHLGSAVFLPAAHEGVVGLIAARICESMQCPSIVFARDQHGNWKGSGRSIPGASLIQILRDPRLQTLIEEYGGHDAAAGLRVKEHHRQRFEAVFARVCSEVLGVPDPVADSPFADTTRISNLPVVDKWYKSYRPDLILTLDELLARTDELQQAATSLEPCGRANPEISVLLPRVRVVHREETQNGHLRIIIEQGARDECDWRTASRVEAIVFARSVAHQMMMRTPNGSPLDIMIQSAFDQRQVYNGEGRSFSLQVLIVQPTAFTPPALTVQAGKHEKPNASERAGATRTPATKTPNLFTHKLEIPTFNSAAELYKRFSITCLTPAVQFRPKQFELIARQFLLDEANPKQNLLLNVNTGAGKTLISFMKIAQILSEDPHARALYLTPQTDLVNQAIQSAQLFFNLNPHEIVKVTGGVPADRRIKNYSGPGRLFIGTPQTVKIDGDISRFSFVALDEIQIMRGDQPDREETLYAYRWVVQQVLALQDRGHPIRFWAQSGTPATSRPESRTRGEMARSLDEELSALAETLRARYEVATLPTGIHSWTPGEVSLSPEFREQLLSIQEAARECYREFLTCLPEWITADECRFDDPIVERRVRRSIREFINSHAKLGPATFMPRGDFIDRFSVNQDALSTLERSSKKKGESEAVNDSEVLGALNTLDSSARDKHEWIWTARSRIHELQVLQRLFISLRSKGRAAFAHDVSLVILKAIYPANKPEPVTASNYMVRALRRPQLTAVLRWAMQEPTTREILKEFEQLYPAPHYPGDIRQLYTRAARTPTLWARLFADAEQVPPIPSGDNAEQVDLQRKEAIEPRLHEEMVSTAVRDPKEYHIEQFLRDIPAGSKTVIICDTKFEARLLAARLSKHGFPALWYAGRSVKRSEKVGENLEAFRRGDVGILCGTSALETGHDIAQVSYILRVVPVTSTTKNAQARGRAARQEGLEGEYQTICIDDPENLDNDEKVKYYRARTRLWAMEKARRKHEQNG